MLSLRQRALRVCVRLVSCATALAGLLIPRPADAEKILFKDNGWEVYTDGRAGAFVSYTYGDGFPQGAYGVASGNVTQLHDIKGGGFSAVAERQLLNDPNIPNNTSLTNQGTINMMRVRSGFVGNQIGVGVRYELSPTLKASAYIQMWMFVESIGRIKNQPNFVDARLGYAKIEGNWGSILAGRTRALFSRGATDIDALYAHRWGVGFPAAIDSNGPTLGQIGFGVLGSGWAAGVVYATPVIAGFQLSAAAFDPIELQGNGSWFRTKFLRPEGELTFERPIGAQGKIFLFVNGAVQDVFKDGYCPPQSATNPLPCQQTAGGFGAGLRFEYGPVHLGFATHRGNGLGLNYALEVSDSSTDPQGNLRASDGYYGQSQFVFGPFDFFAGAGITRIFLTDADKVTIADPTDPTGNRQIVPHSVIKSQFGINGGAVYHLSTNFHIDLDYFRAQADWNLGERQVVNIVNGGMTFNW
ncbi:MAG: porin [Myxococcales bacterium]|nr:porin [Myxococcales bacterium]